MKPQVLRPKSLILCGPTRNGKTQWAKSLGKYIYWKGRPRPRDIWDDDADYLIMDDFTSKPEDSMWKSFMGAQEDADCRDLYFSRQRKWGKVSIYICNIEKLPTLDEWDFGNLEIIHVNKLY